MFVIKTEEYILARDESDFLNHYPVPKYGTYRPQPWFTPDSYPVLFKEVVVVDNPAGADEVYLSFEYNFTEEVL